MALSREDVRRMDAVEERRERQERRVRDREPDLELVASKSDRPAQKGRVEYDSLEEAFPQADPGLKPFGSNVLVQLRTPKLRTSGGIVLSDESRAIDADNTQVAKIIDLGPIAFHNRETLQPWPEGAWVKQGDYVRVPKYGGDRWLMNAPGSVDGKCVFILVNDLDLMGLIPEDKVLSIIAYI